MPLTVGHSVNAAPQARTGKELQVPTKKWIQELPPAPDYLNDVPKDVVPQEPMVFPAANLIGDVTDLRSYALIGDLTYKASKILDHYDVKEDQKLPEDIAKKHPLKIRILSRGGSISAGERVLNTIEGLKEKGFIIETYVGDAASMAAIIALSGSPGHRFIAPHGKLMLHQARQWSFGTLTTHDTKQRAKILDEIEQRMNAYLVKQTDGKLTLEDIESKYGSGQDWYVSPEEAKQYNLAEPNIALDELNEATLRYKLMKYAHNLAYLFKTVTNNPFGDSTNLNFLSNTEKNDDDD